MRGAFLLSVVGNAKMYLYPLCINEKTVLLHHPSVWDGFEVWFVTLSSPFICVTKTDRSNKTNKSNKSNKTNKTNKANVTNKTNKPNESDKL